MRSPQTSTLFVLTALLIFGVVSTASADIYLQIAPEKGESTRKGFEGWIEAQSFSFGLSNSGSSARAGGGASSAGKANFNDISFTKYIDRTSTALFVASATGKRYPSVVLQYTISNPGGAETVLYKITLSDVMISSIQVGGAGADRPTESVAMNFAKIEIEYFPQREKGPGGPNPSVKAGFDLAANKAL